MNIHEQIKTEHDARIPTPHNDEVIIVKDYTLLIVSLFAILLGTSVYYWEMVMDGEGYRHESDLSFTPEQVEVINERRVCMAVNENPDCCSGRFTEKLKGIWGCL